jgi:hypothetical protein
MNWRKVVVAALRERDRASLSAARVKKREENMREIVVGCL